MRNYIKNILNAQTNANKVEWLEWQMKTNIWDLTTFMLKQIALGSSKDLLKTSLGEIRFIICESYDQIAKKKFEEQAEINKQLEGK